MYCFDTQFEFDAESDDRAELERLEDQAEADSQAYADAMESTERCVW